MDVRTLFNANLVLIIGYGIALWMLARTQPYLGGVRWMTRAYAVGATGMFLLGMVHRSPYTFTVAAGGSMVVLMAVFVHFAMEEFAGNPRIWRRADFVVIGATPALLLWFSFADYSAEARIISFSLAVATEMILAALALLPPARNYQDVSIWAMIALACTVAVSNLGRVVLTVIRGPASPMIFDNPPEAVFMFIAMLVTAGGAFGFIWMTTARLRKELELQARTDSLTGLLNRRALMDQVEREIARSQRSGSPMSLIVIDIDYFKRLNDTWGHEAGDEALHSVAETFRTTLRRTDLLARYGGEEFLIVLPDTPREEALRLAQRLRIAVEDLVIPFANDSIRLTASFGVAVLDPELPEENWSRLLRRGDRALYHAKEGGRNCVVLT